MHRNPCIKVSAVILTNDDGVVLEPHLVDHVGDYTTPAANEADTDLLSQVYRAQLPAGQHARAQAEIAPLIWLRPAAFKLPEGYRLAPLSSMVLQELAHGSVR